MFIGLDQQERSTIIEAVNIALDGEVRRYRGAVRNGDEQAAYLYRAAVVRMCNVLHRMDPSTHEDLAAILLADGKGSAYRRP